MRWRWALLLLTACAPCETPEVLGSSVSRRSIAQNAVNSFFAAIGDTEVCVPDVRFIEKDASHFGGRYSPVSKRIVAVEDLVPDELIPHVITHELCHAADLQHGYMWANRELWADKVPSYGRRISPHEDFANHCGRGPLIIQTMGESCPEDDPGAEVFSALLQVYDAPIPEVREVGWQQVGLASTALGQVGDLVIRGAADGAIRLAYTRDGVSEVAFVDLVSGRPRDLQPIYALDPVPAPELSWWYHRKAAVGDQALVLAVVEADGGGRARRLVHRGPQGVSRVACARAGEVVFAADGGLWSAWMQDGVLWWGRWQSADG